MTDPINPPVREYLENALQKGRNELREDRAFLAIFDEVSGYCRGQEDAERLTINIMCNLTAAFTY